MASGSKSPEAGGPGGGGRKRPRPCPTCSKMSTAEFWPFCSKRCADIDLGRWLSEEYRVPAAERPMEDDGGEADQG